jgi:hypothetical protein
MAGRDRLATESVDHAVAEGGVEPGRVGSAAGNGGKAGDRHEGARVAGGPARRPELAEADVRRREPERGGDRRGVRRRSHLGRSLRNREAGAAMPVRHRLERAAHRPDLLFQHDLAAGGGAVAQPEQHRGPHRRVACERQLARRGEDANAGAVGRVLGREHEHRLRMVELARDRLHRRRLQSIAVEHDGERIAGEAPVGEHVERHELPAHRFLHRAFRRNRARRIS